jgi:hypothetical protein
MKKNRLYAMAVLFTLPALCSAGSHTAVVDKPLVAQTLDTFNEQSARIREQMQPGNVYGFIKPADKSRVEARLDDMLKLLQSHASESDMKREEKVRLANDQEAVNGILRHNDINRLVCESRAPVGSHIPVTTCRPFGEVEQERREAQKSMYDLSSGHH